MDKLAETTKTDRTRVEKDPLGRIEVPAQAYYGAQTARALENFKVSAFRLPWLFIRAYAIIKKAAAIANMRAGRLEREKGNAIVEAADELIQGKFKEQFRLDAFQAGAGTSTNMNLNEVIANRATEILGGRRGQYYVHPNDHVNMSQSSNDTFHAALHIALVDHINLKLLPTLENLKAAFDEKAKEFWHIIKPARTHLQDAVPIRLGQEFSAYSQAIANDIRRLKGVSEKLLELPLGGTAVGTGLNAAPDFAENAIAEIKKMTDFDFKQAPNLFEAISSADEELEFAAAMKILATNLIKVSSDLRLLSSGPSAGFGEIKLPAVQPGSSIMPGKVNPSVPEMLEMVCFQVIGCETAVGEAARGGQLDMNVFLPIIAFNALECTDLSVNAIHTFTESCVRGIIADEKRCRELLEKDSAIITALAPKIGYEKAAEIAKRALESGRSIREIARESKALSKKELEDSLRFEDMV